MNETERKSENKKKTDIVNQDENHRGNLVNGDDDAQLLLAKRR